MEVEFLKGPTVLDKTVGEIVQQGRVAGRASGGAEVVRGADEAFSKMPVPDPVDDDPGGEGVPW